MPMMCAGSFNRLAAVLLASLACAAPAAGQLRDTPDKPGMLVSPGWLKDHLDDRSVVVISIDEDDAFRRGHIRGASWLRHDATIGREGHRLLAPGALADALGRVGARDDARIVLYGDEPMAVGWVYLAFVTLGHGDHTSLLDGNLRSWSAAGYPVATGPAAPVQGKLTPKPAVDVTVDAPWVKDHLNDPSIRLVDVRSEREWEGGMIPNAGPLLWRELFADPSAGRFKTPDQIRALFARAGVGADQTAVTYCAIGMRASLAYFAARLAGIPARVYQGSMSDWAGRPGYPLVRK